MSWFSQNSVRILLCGSSCLEGFLRWGKKKKAHNTSEEKRRQKSSVIFARSVVENTLSSVNLLRKEAFDTFLGPFLTFFRSFHCREICSRPSNGC